MKGFDCEHDDDAEEKIANFHEQTIGDWDFTAPSTACRMLRHHFPRAGSQAEKIANFDEQSAANANGSA
jgi:hypothetical protein